MPKPHITQRYLENKHIDYKEKDIVIIHQKGIQLVSFFPSHHSPNLPGSSLVLDVFLDLSQRTSAFPSRSPSFPQRALLSIAEPKGDCICKSGIPSKSATELATGGKCSKRNGMGDDMARRIVDCVNADSEIKRATVEGGGI